MAMAAQSHSHELQPVQPLAVKRRVATSSPAGTCQLAGALAGFLQTGDLVLLFGDLGAGKTTLVQGIAEALGVSEPVTSPTFALAHHYEIAAASEPASVEQLRHLDLYRLNDPEELLDYVIEELEQAVVLVEWGEPLAAAFPANRLELAITFDDAPDARQIELAGFGQRWSQVWDQLVQAVAGTGEPANS